MLARGRVELKELRDNSDPSESMDFLLGVKGSLKLTQQIRFPQQSIASNLENVATWYSLLKTETVTNVNVPFDANFAHSLSEKSRGTSKMFRDG